MNGVVCLLIIYNDIEEHELIPDQEDVQSESLMGQKCLFNGFPCRYNSYANCLEIKVDDNTLGELLEKTENTKLPFYIKSISLIIEKNKSDKLKKVNESADGDFLNHEDEENSNISESEEGEVQLN